MEPESVWPEAGPPSGNGGGYKCDSDIGIATRPNNHSRGRWEGAHLRHGHIFLSNLFSFIRIIPNLLRVTYRNNNNNNNVSDLSNFGRNTILNRNTPSIRFTNRKMKKVLRRRTNRLIGRTIRVTITNNYGSNNISDIIRLNRSANVPFIDNLGNFRDLLSDNSDHLVITADNRNNNSQLRSTTDLGGLFRKNTITTGPILYLLYLSPFFFFPINSLNGMTTIKGLLRVTKNLRRT